MMSKRFFAFFLIFCLTFSVAGCAKESTPPGNDGLNIVATVFPAYDFAREIAGEYANITLLIPPGTEIHGFEPTPQDVIRIQDCDLLICNGGESEAWLEEILGGIDWEIPTVRMMDCVETVEEETKEGMQEAGHAHAHEGGEHRHDKESKHEKEFDEHVWSSPVNAALICSEICRAVCYADKSNALAYIKNSGRFISELNELDSRIRTIVENASCRTVIFADRFPVRYFVEEYGLDYYAAFPGCAEDTEPSAKTVAFLIDRVREYNIPAVFYIEFSNEKMADIICEDTGCKKLVFYSCQNISAKEFASGVTYLDLMNVNADNLREALG